MSEIPICVEEYESIMEKCRPHFEKLAEIIMESGEKPEGDIYQAGNVLSYPNTAVQINLMTLARKAETILEIGFNAGYSAVMMLTANSNCTIDDIDICEHKYTIPCFTYLSSVFPNRLRLLKGHSHDILKQYTERCVDMVHIDGSHDIAIANIDYFLSLDKVRKGGIIIMDDTWLYNINFLWEGYIRDNHMAEFHLVPTNRHRFGYKII